MSDEDDRHQPPLGLQMLLLVALRELGHGQVWVQPVYLGGLEVLEDEAVAQAVLDVGPHTATGQHHVYDILRRKQRGTGTALIHNRKLRVFAFATVNEHLHVFAFAPLQYARVEVVQVTHYR